MGGSRRQSIQPARQAGAPFGRGGPQHGVVGMLALAKASVLVPPLEAATGNATDKLARLEAVLMLAKEPLSSRKLAELADLADGTEARTLVRRLRDRLRARSSAFLPVELAGGVLLMTRPELAPWLTRILGAEEDAPLSTPALEALTVVAYRQPVTRAEVEAVRGVQCGEILRVLMQRDLLRIVGRSEELGRPFLYGTTRRFLKIFGLNKLDQLPRIGETRSKFSSQANRSDRRRDAPFVVGECLKE